MKKVVYAGFLGIVLLMCLTLSVGMALFGPAQAGANEQLQQPPAWKTEEGDLNPQVLTQLQAYVNDRFFLRQELISVNNLLDPGSDSVIRGKEGWLFFADTKKQYTAMEPMSEREQFCAVRNLQLMQQYCMETGKEFAFMIAPNKNSLYGQYMPNYGVRAEKTQGVLLLERLKTEGVHTVDLFEAFRQQSESLYFAHDSHWNAKGAALGADLVNEAFGVKSNYFGGDFSKCQPHTGDLYAMLYPSFTDPETGPVYGGQLSYTFTSKATRPDAIVLNTQSQKAGSLLAYRDSFGNLLFPYLADSYGAAKFSRSSTYDLTGEEDYVLIELVERNLSYLYENMPLMQAPVRQLAIPDSCAGSIVAETADRGQLTQIRGQLPRLDATSPVYVLSDHVVYEAFCLAEGGFGLSLPKGATAQGVLCMVNGEITMYEIQ